MSQTPELTKNGATSLATQAATIAPQNPMATAMAMYNQPQTLAVIRDQICPGATPSEMWVFLSRCAALELDPFSGQIFFIKRKDKVSHQISIDGFRASAERTGELVMISDPEFEGETKTANGRKAPALARVIVTREVRGKERQFSGVARFDEFVPAPPNDFMWNKMPFHMIGKCAEAQAMRKAFPHRFGDLTSGPEATTPDGIFAGTVQDRAQPPEAQFVEVVDPKTGEMTERRAADEYDRLYPESEDKTSTRPSASSQVIDGEARTVEPAADEGDARLAEVDAAAEREANELLGRMPPAEAPSGAEQSANDDSEPSDMDAICPPDFDTLDQLHAAALRMGVKHPRPLKGQTTEQYRAYRGDLQRKMHEAQGSATSTA
jgi:phage recombination protein Bet